MLLGWSDTLSSNKFITPWSFIHFMSGVVMYRIKPDMFFGLFVHTLYELKDIYVASKVKKLNFDNWRNNSILNCVGDTLFFVLGQMVSSKIKLPTRNLIVLLVIYFSLFYTSNLG